ncbi:DrmB family protein [Streptomyces sp. NPDC059909]|uniref:DrmB family protein n=1 Tax=Streptomyces sp. NPDC059909 TaxID=3346998 RepID=UPI00365B3D3D
MPQPSRRARSGSRLQQLRAQNGPRKLGSARRAQMITTYGVGSMIAIDSESFIVRGIDSWHVPSEFELTEPRLQQQLNVDGFHLPPAATDDRATKDGVHVARFPEWYSCSTCHALSQHRRLTAEPKKNKCGKCETTELTPSRFVMACENGHLDDFPYWQWVHKAEGSDGGSGTHQLEIHMSGRTASLRSIQIRCSCGVAPKSLEGALGRKALVSLGIRCTGRRPWLKNDENPEGCTAAPRAIQRGSSAAWFPQVASALTIPPWSQGANKLIRPYMSKFRDRTDEQILTYIEMTPQLARSGYEATDLLAAVRVAQRAAETRELSEENTAAVLIDPLRRDEYEQLQRATVHDHLISPDFETEDPGPMGDLADHLGIEQVMLVPRLREVRAMTHFTRLTAPSPAAPERHSGLARNPQGWLPAIEVIGEGVFLRFDRERVARWEQEQAEVRRRANVVREHHMELLAAQAGPDGDPELSPVTPRLMLVHTLAHVLINEWSLDCGYPASALRERLYVDDEMTGVLIYTATSDSAGSLGGLVNQGKPDALRRSLETALARATWCSADPLCIESPVSGADNVNLAACHCCVLLPETSCEQFNRFLDRGMLVGTPEDPASGFFYRKG